MSPPTLVAGSQSGARPAPVDLNELQLPVLGAIAAGKPLAVVADLLCREAERLAPEVTSALVRIRAAGWHSPDRRATAACGVSGGAAGDRG